jgi:hypothetical protein
MIGLCVTQIKVRGVFSVQYEDGAVDDVHVDAIRLVEGVCFWLLRIETQAIVGSVCLVFRFMYCKIGCWICHCFLIGQMRSSVWILSQSNHRHHVWGVP